MALRVQQLILKNRDLFLSLLLIFVCTTVIASDLEKLDTFQVGIELPEGSAKLLITTACTKCHDLKGIPAYKGYWNRAQWLSMVETMVEHGAELNASESGKIADYLTRHFGPQ